jgi:hypothetical protein
VWEGIQLPAVSFVRHLWESFAYDIDGTEAKTQVAMENLIKNVLKDAAGNCLRPHFRMKVHDPTKFPDVSFTCLSDIQLSWQTLLIPMEFESARRHKEGIGQLISYLSISLDESKKSSRIGVYSDGYVMDIFRLKPAPREPEPYVYHLGLKTFLPLVKPTSFTDGFYAFVRLLLANLNDLEAIAHPKFLIVNNIQMEMLGFIASGCHSNVYKSRDERGFVAVKISDGGFHFNAEMKVLRTLNPIDPHGDYFPLLESHSTVTALVLRPLADHTLHSYINVQVLTRWKAIRIIMEVLFFVFSIDS